MGRIRWSAEHHHSLSSDFAHFVALVKKHKNLTLTYSTVIPRLALVKNLYRVLRRCAIKKQKRVVS